MMLALQKVMVTTCGRWLKSAIKLALRDLLVKNTKLNEKTSAPSVLSVAFIISEGISSASNMLHFNATVDADKPG